MAWLLDGGVLLAYFITVIGIGRYKGRGDKTMEGFAVGNRSIPWLRRRAVDMHGACAAQRLAATELGPGHAEHVAQHPQQRGVAVDIDLMGCAVDLQRESHGCL
jgi:hypothetical protein